jgi:predicted HicB family RNase H-like nuclease
MGMAGELRLRHLPPDLHRRLKVAAAEREIDLNELCLQFLAEGLDRLQKAKK